MAGLSSGWSSTRRNNSRRSLCRRCNRRRSRSKNNPVVLFRRDGPYPRGACRLFDWHRCSIGMASSIKANYADWPIVNQGKKRSRPPGFGAPPRPSAPPSGHFFRKGRRSSIRTGIPRTRQSGPVKQTSPGPERVPDDSVSHCVRTGGGDENDRQLAVYLREATLAQDVYPCSNRAICSTAFAEKVVPG